MITLVQKNLVEHFRCISLDINTNRHIPDADGYMEGYKLQNGDELFNMETGDAYVFDEENNRWVLL